MNNRVWIRLFFIDLAAELVAIGNNWTLLRFFTKPLLVALLLTWFITSSKTITAARVSIIAALLFSWLGDTVLLLEDKGAVYFMAGLGSFLLAHIAYIFFFLQAGMRQRKRPLNLVTIAAIVAYGAILFSLLAPALGNLQLPVLLYAIVLCTMLAFAIHTFPPEARKARWYCVFGAILFVISDSLLALNKFRYPFPEAGIIVMLSYALAQYALVKAALTYLAGNIQSARTAL